MASGDKIALPAQAAGFVSLLGNIETGTGDTLNLPEGMINIGGNGLGYLLAAQADWDPVAVTNRDSSFTVLALGDNLYIYAVQDVSGTAKWIASKNSTFPTGYDAVSSRKVGGFHYGRVRAVNSDGVPVDAVNAVYGAGWESNVTVGILPNSVWDLVNRPKCDPTGMAKINDTTWADIYLVSAAVAVSITNGKLTAGLGQSAYNATPLTGTEDLSFYTFNELAKRQGKRLLSLSEWLQAAEGSPEGNDADNNDAWTATTNSGRTTTGAVANAVSAKGIVDCVGNVWECPDTFLIREGDTTGFSWFDAMPGEGVGQLNMHHSLSLTMVSVGGSWGFGVKSGSRSMIFSFNPWMLSSQHGSRFACDAL